LLGFSCLPPATHGDLRLPETIPDTLDSRSMRTPNLVAILSLSIDIPQVGPSGHEAVAPMPLLTEASPIRIAEGPILLYANAAGEWGGHTFSYTMTSDRYVFWAGMLYESGRTSRTCWSGSMLRRMLTGPRS